MRNLLIVSLVSVLIASSVPIAESVLWDLLIYANIENTPIYDGKNPIVKGVVKDHAGKPVPNVQIEIRVGGQTVVLDADEVGTFEYEIENTGLIPGMHIVNIKATAEGGKTGLSTVNFQVHGKVDVSAQTAKLLETTHAKRYLNSSPEDFENDPLGLSLYYHYKGIYEKFLEQEAIQKE